LISIAAEPTESLWGTLFEVLEQYREETGNDAQIVDVFSAHDVIDHETNPCVADLGTSYRVILEEP